MTVKQLILFMLLFSSVANAQQTKKMDYFATTTDTTFCTALSFDTEQSNGELNYLEYTDLQGKEFILKGKENIPDILTFHIGNNAYDKQLDKASKVRINFIMRDLFAQDSIKIHPKKIEKPIITLIVSQSTYTRTRSDGIGGPNSSTRKRISAFYMQGDGNPDVTRLTYYYANLKPFLLNNPEAMREYTIQKRWWVPQTIGGIVGLGGFAGMGIVIFSGAGTPAGLIALSSCLTGFAIKGISKKVKEKHIKKAVKFYNEDL